MQRLIAHGHSAAKIHLRDFDFAIFLQVHRFAGHRPFQMQARVTALPHDSRIRFDVERLNGELGNAETALGQEVLRPIWINLFERLRRHDAQLTRERPAPDLFSFHDAPQNLFGARSAETPQSFDGFELQKVGRARRQIALGNSDQPVIRILLAGQADFIQRKRLNERVERIEDAEDKMSALGSAARSELTHNPVMR